MTTKPARKPPAEIRPSRNPDERPLVITPYGEAIVNNVLAPSPGYMTQSNCSVPPKRERLEVMILNPADVNGCSQFITFTRARCRWVGYYNVETKVSRRWDVK